MPGPWSWKSSGVVWLCEDCQGPASRNSQGRFVKVQTYDKGWLHQVHWKWRGRISWTRLVLFRNLWAFAVFALRLNCFVFLSSGWVTEWVNIKNKWLRIRSRSSRSTVERNVCWPILPEAADKSGQSKGRIYWPGPDRILIFSKFGGGWWNNICTVSKTTVTTL